MKRGLLTKNLEKCSEFIVEYSVSIYLLIPVKVLFIYNLYVVPQENFAEKSYKKPVEFVIVPENIQKLKSKYNVPNFKITGKLDSLVCSLKYPLTGEVFKILVMFKMTSVNYFDIFKIIIESCDEKIKSVEVQLVRVETCGCAEGYSKDGE